MLTGLLDDVRGAGNHWEGLRHPSLSLDVGLLGIRSAALVEDSLVRIVGAPDHWQPLYTTGVLLRVGGRSVVWG